MWVFHFRQDRSIEIGSEGGTEEDRRIDPPLNFGIFIELGFEKQKKK